jgi:hypothetical protein
VSLSQRATPTRRQHTLVVYLNNCSSYTYVFHPLLTASVRARVTCSEYARTTGWTSSVDSLRGDCQRLVRNNASDGDVVSNNRLGPARYAWTIPRTACLHRVATWFVATRVPLGCYTTDVLSVELRSAR